MASLVQIWLDACLIWTHYVNQCWFLSTTPLETNVSELWIKIQQFSLRSNSKMLKMATLPESLNAISWNALFQHERYGSFATSNIFENMVSCVWYLFGSQWTELMYPKNTFKCLTDVPIPLAVTSVVVPLCRLGPGQHFGTLFILRTTKTQIE